MKRVVTIKIEVDPEEVEQYRDKVMFSVYLKDAMNKVLEHIDERDWDIYHSDKYAVDYQVKYPDKWFHVSMCQVAGDDFMVKASTSAEAKQIARELWINHKISLDSNKPQVTFNACEADLERYPDLKRFD